MTTIIATSVAEKLMDLFSCHGVPREILTDQGTNFMSELLQELHKLLGIKSICTSPYHPQTDSLVERFSQTLKQMLKRVLMTDRRSWDKLLPLVLFVYREVPSKIKQKLRRVNYEVIIDSEGNTKVYHINLLKKWFSRTETVSSYANTVEEDANMEL